MKKPVAFGRASKATGSGLPNTSIHFGSPAIIAHRVRPDPWLCAPIFRWVCLYRRIFFNGSQHALAPSFHCQYRAWMSLGQWESGTSRVQITPYFGTTRH